MDAELRLSRLQRLRAGCAVALIYLLCVMTPSLAMALPGSAIPDCLLLDGAAAVHVHMHDTLAMLQPDKHDAGHIHLMADNNKPVTPDTAPQPAHSSSGSSCCELMCLTALPATAVDIAPPAQMASRGTDQASRAMTGRAPPRRYRPPIFPG